MEIFECFFCSKTYPAEGIFCDPASATVLATATRLSRRSLFKSRDRIVLVITGSGLKTIEDLDARQIRSHDVRLEGLEEKIASVIS